QYGMISRPAGTNYKLSPETANKLRQQIQDAKNLEERVKAKWFEQLAGTNPKLPTDEAWKALRIYLSRTFRRHGIQAAALLDPTINTPPEYEASLSSIMKDAIKENISKELHGEAERAISDFLALVGTDTDRTNYIIQLADGAFNFYTLAVPVNIADKFRSELSELTLFLDTNFLFGIMDLSYNAQVKVSHDLLRAISVHKLPFKLRYHEATEREMRNTIYYYGSILQSRHWTQSLSKAASRSGNLSGIEQKFHEKNSTQAIDAKEFLRPYQHFDELLLQKNIEVYKTSTQRQQAQIDLYHSYQEFLVNNGRGDKAYETVMHDAILLEEVKHLRSNAKSSLDAGALIITCDYYFYRFDWESARRNGHLACVLLPNIFWQILRPFIPSDRDFDKAFAETFALPEFRTLSSRGSKACSKMMQILATYKDVPEQTVFKMLSNDLLLDNLRAVQNDAQFAEQVEVAFVAENRNLLEEKVALEQQLEEEKIKRAKETTARQKESQEYQKDIDRLNENLATIREEIKTAEQAIQEHQHAADSAIMRAKKAEQFAREAYSKVAGMEQDIQKAEQKAFRMSIIAGIAIGIILVISFEMAVHLIPWKWLIEHPNSYGLQGAFDLLLVFFVIGLFIQKWRMWCWGAGAFAITCIIFQIIGGPEKPPAK
ncbi:MAG: hypothetical protein AB1485_07530, partial [Candidatus Thermoplasmatota archaeon]